LSALLLALAALLVVPGMNTARAEVTDLADGPLTHSAVSEVRPNLLFILDDSGSMAWQSLTGTDGTGQHSTSVAEFYSAILNGAYYNPNITYSPGVKSDSSSLGNSVPKAALNDAYIGTGTTNLETLCYSKPDQVPPLPGTPDPPVPMVSSNTTACKAAKDATYNTTRGKFAFFYQYDNSLFKAGTFDCRFTPPALPNTTNKNCYKRVDIVSTTASYPIRLPSGIQVKKPDGTNATRTYAEEIQNFANWHSYYRSRMNIMKTASGQAFSSVRDNFRVGFLTINPGKDGDTPNPVVPAKYLKIARFDQAHKDAWYKLFYGQTTNGSTPLRSALARAGRHFAGITTDINNGMAEDPLEYSCQQNFALLTTDGYWNDSSGGPKHTSNATVGDQDSKADLVAPFYVTRLSGTLDGKATADTLADVAMYYYKTDLRTAAQKPKNLAGAEVYENNVRTTDKDFATHQHMTTFTLGLGVSGKMRFPKPDEADYEQAASGDFYNIKSGASDCSWEPGKPCNWPVPVSNTNTTLDDLWHTAVNGRGQYFSAKEPTSLVSGLRKALEGINLLQGAAAASATSSPNVTKTENLIYSSIFNTSVWTGEIFARRLDPANGLELIPKVWSTDGVDVFSGDATVPGSLDARTKASTDDRSIYTLDSGALNKLKSFEWVNLAAEKSFFENKCVAPYQLSHCGELVGTPELVTANSGEALVNYLRGRTGNEGSVFRDRTAVLGDTVSAAPHFLKAPRYEFAHDDYAKFKNDNAKRQPMLYVGANDGMMHALNADNGTEVWAYIPKMLLPDLYNLADKDYPGNHQFYVDGTPETMDIFDGSNWKTILVSGLNKGGRGFYALDVTIPDKPEGMWEICSDKTRCAIFDEDIGYSYGRVVVTKRKSNGQWVVIITSGYNNIKPGDGKGYLYVLDAFTGKILEKVSTGVGGVDGSCAAPALCGPSGLGRIGGYAESFLTDNTDSYVYGGDLWGNLWRFDLTKAATTVLKLAELKDAGGKPQSITTVPQVTVVDGKYRVVYAGTGRFLGMDDIGDPAKVVPALSYAYQNSFYAIKDTDKAYGNIRSLVGLVSGGMIPRKVTENPANGERKITGDPSDFAKDTGWFFDFNPDGVAPGERLNVDAELTQRTLFFVTNIPKVAAVCGGTGEHFPYSLDYKSGLAVNTAPGGVIGTRGSGIAVGVILIRLPDGSTKAIITTESATKRVAGVQIGSQTPTVKRMSWREIISQ